VQLVLRSSVAVSHLGTNSGLDCLSSLIADSAVLRVAVVGFDRATMREVPTVVRRTYMARLRTNHCHSHASCVCNEMIQLTGYEIQDVGYEAGIAIVVCLLCMLHWREVKDKQVTTQY